MKKLLIAFLLLFSFPIFAENLRDLPFEKILTSIDKQCRNGNKTACHSLVDLYRLGNENLNIPKNEEREKEYSLLSCKILGDFSCITHPDYIIKNYKKLCNSQTHHSGITNCIVAALPFYRDNEKVKSYLTKLCNNKFGTLSCISLSIPLDNKQKMKNYIEEQCQQKNYWACWSLSRIYDKELINDTEKRRKYLQIMEQINIEKCDKENEPYHCSNMCDYYQQNGDKEKQKFYAQKTLDIYKQECNNKLPKNLGIRGFSTPCKVVADYIENEEERKEYLQKGCDIGDTDSCTDLAAIHLNLSMSYRHVSDEQSKEYYGKSCDLGDINSCILYKNFHTLLLYKTKRPIKDIWK